MPKKKAVEGSPKKRDHSVASGLDKRLIPLSLEKRVSKKVDRFTETAEHPRQREEVVVKKGKGKKLRDIDNVEPEIARRTNKDELLRDIHSLAFGGRPTKKTEVKDDLLAFSGVVYDDDEKGREKLEDRIWKRRKNNVQHVLAFFGQDPKGEKEDLVKRLIDFLEKPSASKETYDIPPPTSGRSRSKSKSKSSGGGKGKKGKSRKKKDPNAPKRALSAYMFFVKDNRKDIARRHPDEKITEIAKRLGSAWGKLTNAEKRKYQDKSDKDKDRYDREMKSYKRRK